MLLFQFLTKDIGHFEHFTEHCRSCTSAFLRGFFDAEGSSSGGQVSCSNTNHRLLVYVQRLLESRYSLRVSGPYEQGLPPGRTVLIKGQPYKVNKQCYSIRLSKASSLEFGDRIGFTIPRKQRGIARPS